MKADYSPRVSCRSDFELAETFFNSITRRIFSTVGVDPQIEFIDSDFDPPQPGSLPPLYNTYVPQGADLGGWVYSILANHPFGDERRPNNVDPASAVQPPEPGGIPGYEDGWRDARLAAREIYTQICEGCERRIVRVEVLRQEFYRNLDAYLIGRVIVSETGAEIFEATGGHTVDLDIIPLVLCLRNDGRGVYVDAVLLDENEVSIVFSFTRSYFHVETGRPHELAAFLKSIMPLKRLAELYISIGYNKHGKTELYRHLLNHLSTSTDRFEIARGEPGMVMAVFTLPSYDMVFKIIKDRIDPPKTTSRQEVMERYDLVFKHDKAGRLVDAQEFEHLTFDRQRFSEALLSALAGAAPQSVTITNGNVSIRHLYTERRLSPLNLYIKEAGEEAAAAAVIDYGQAIKDLAATNIFPGDVLLKNFGVTRHGRVVFYDYDELCRVTDCKFRKVPPPRSFDDEFEADPWFYVGPMDIFPEEFRTFLGLQEPLRSLFVERHGDLFEADYWRDVQKRHTAGEIVDIMAYPESRKLRRAS
jgi:isocitrate dehydrogenase kinase/phosphatase